MTPVTPFAIGRRSVLRLLVLPAGVALAACASAPVANQAASGTPVSAAAATPTTAPTLPAVVAATIPLTQPPVATVAPSPVVTAALAAPAPTATAAPTAAPTGIPAAPSAPAPCAAPMSATPAQTEGPYYRANPPERSSLVEPGMAGTRLVLTGQVRTPTCAPVSRARVDLWQADDKGSYDNSGYRLRGYVLTDADGAYRIETIVPGLYPGRTRHVHVKVLPPGHAGVTTQLYFPDEPANARDSIFDPRLLMTLEDGATGKTGVFNFVVPGT